VDNTTTKQEKGEIKDCVPMIKDSKDDYYQDATQQPSQQHDCDCACVYDRNLTAPMSVTVDGRHQAPSSGGYRNGISLWRIIMMR
jgi:hypothetical protein